MKRAKCHSPPPQFSSLVDRVYTASGVQNCVFDLIQRRAYELYEERRHQPGHDVEDWLKAEQEITRQLGAIGNDTYGFTSQS